METDRFFWELLKSARLNVVRLNPDGAIVFCNDFLLRMTGWDLEEVVGRNWFDLFLEQPGRKTVSSLFRESIANKDIPLHFENPIVARDGRQILIRWNNTLLSDRRGNVLGTVSIGEDVTEQRRSEVRQVERLCRVQRQQEVLLSISADDALAAGDVEAAFRLVTESVAEATGVERVSIWLLSPDGRELRCADLYSRSGKSHERGAVLQSGDYPRYFHALETGKVIDADEARIDPRTSEFTEGYLVPLGITAMLDAAIWVRGKIAGVVCHEHVGGPRSWHPDERIFAGAIGQLTSSILSNAERTTATGELRESQRSLASLIGNLPGMAYRCRYDKDWTIEFVSGYCAELTGYDPRDLIGSATLSYNDIIHPDDRQPVWDAVQAGVAEGRPYQLEYRIRTAGGQEKWVWEQGSAIRASDGEIVALEGFIADITERKRAEAALRESETRYRTLMELANDGIVMSDPETGIILDVNRRMESLLGLPAERIVGNHRSELHPPGEISVAREGFRGDVPGESFMAEAVLRGRDGRTIPVEINSNIITLGGKRVALGIFRDISERKKTEGELAKAHKLESLGILAGGIAHDFNNFLTAILGYLSMSRVELRKEDKAYTLLGEAEKASMRAADLTRQLLTFSMGGAPVKKVVPLGELVRESAAFCLRGAKTACEFTIPGDLWPAEVDEGQITQVIHNLVINADQATPEGGTVAIRCDNVRLRAGEVPSLPQGSYVKITVADRGAGIPPENLSRIFDPYFSTKPTGSGLGLAVVYSILRKHDGHIAAESNPGTGTVFRLYLPAAEGRSPERLPEEEPLARNRGRILVMDDDEAVRNIARVILRTSGYDVELAGDGEEAVASYRAARDCGKPFDAVILDLTVPGKMGGRKAVAELLSIDPDARAIVSSGYSSDPVMGDHGKFGFRGVVPKPYTPRQLNEAVRKVLAGTGSTSGPTTP